uniref:Uncharacterized protein n=1 Tax=Romanomermis culicivorax TaxID=13658 RepID=A0A915KJV3_ROMCU
MTYVLHDVPKLTLSLFKNNHFLLENDIPQFFDQMDGAEDVEIQIMTRPVGERCWQLELWNMISLYKDPRILDPDSTAI